MSRYTVFFLSSDLVETIYSEKDERLLQDIDRAMKDPANQSAIERVNAQISSSNLSSYSDNDITRLYAEAIGMSTVSIGDRSVSPTYKPNSELFKYIKKLGSRKTQVVILDEQNILGTIGSKDELKDARIIRDEPSILKILTELGPDKSIIVGLLWSEAVQKKMQSESNTSKTTNGVQVPHVIVAVSPVIIDHVIRGGKLKKSSILLGILRTKLVILVVCAVIAYLGLTIADVFNIP